MAVPYRRIISAVTRRLPPVPGAGRLVNALVVRELGVRRATPVVPTKGPRTYYDHGHRRVGQPVLESEVLGLRMVLDLHEYVDLWLFYAPQFYERGELRFVRDHLARGGTFLDVGAYIGLYALVAARQVGAAGRALAVEAHPDSAARLRQVVELNGLRNVLTVETGVSDRVERRKLVAFTDWNRAGASFLWEEGRGPVVSCRPLLDILQEQSVERVAGAKFDIAGYEHRVLRRFFETADPALWPYFLLVEHMPEWVELAGGDAVELARARGYRVVATFRAGSASNVALIRDR